MKERAELVENLPAGLSLRAQCELLGISRGAYYYEPRPESAENLALLRQLDELHLERPVFGGWRLSLLPCLVCLTEIVMRHTRHYSRATRRWHSLVGIRWQRLQSRISGAYFQRVTQPLKFWHALGCPSQFRPSLPWWQPFVWRWLVVIGWVRPSRRRQWPV